MSLSIPALNEGELERLALLSEELGEVQKAIGKILRHGYESYNPTVEIHLTNRKDLEIKIGHLNHALMLLSENGDISASSVLKSISDRQESIAPWLHYQSSPKKEKD